MKIYRPIQDHFVLEQLYPATSFQEKQKQVTRQMYETNRQEIESVLFPVMQRYSFKMYAHLGKTILRLSEFSDLKKNHIWAVTLYGDTTDISYAISRALNTIAIGETYHVM